MRNETLRAISFAAIGSLTLWLASSASQAAPEKDSAVDFTLDRLHGSPVRLSDYRGQWVVLNYWATWCAPCRKEMPELSELHRQRDDVTVLGLAFEEVDKSEFEAFLEEILVAFPILLVDVYAPPEPFGAPRVLPTSILLNPDGGQVKSFVGPVTRAQIEGAIDGWSPHE